MKPAWPPVATAVALSHFGLLLVVQLETFFLHVHTTADGPRGVATFLALFPLSQLEHAIVCALLGGLYWLIVAKLGGRALHRWALFALLVALSAYVVVDQVVYGVFYRHIHLSLHEGELPSLGQVTAAFLAATNRVFFVNVVLVTALAALQYRLVVRDASVPLPRLRLLRGRAALAAVYLVASAGVTFGWPHDDLEHHPVVALLAVPADGWKRAVDIQRIPPSLYLPRFGEVAEAPDAALGLASARRALRSAHPHPSVLFVVLESVGSGQLFTSDGRLSPVTTPFLHEVSDRSIHFPNVYAAHPATILSHLPLETGGYGITWGSVFTDLEKQYAGATLPSVFKQAGYATWLVSSGDLTDGNMGSFYRKLPWDRYWDFGVQTEDAKRSLRLGPWGGRDDLVIAELDRCLDELGREKPFYASVLTISTHHPYVVPPGYTGPREGGGDADRYVNAIHYADSVLRKIFEDLGRRGRLEDTLVFITGDHGQAFGDLHRHNLTHRNRIYEENIRTFLILIDPKAPRGGPLLSRRIGSTGDILPTIADAAGLPAPTVLGQSMLADDHRGRVAFFFKAAHPEQWGLRDGRWKFIARARKELAEPELYDLEADPTEQRNLARAHPDRISVYHSSCSQWYFGMQAEMGRRLIGYQPFAGGELAPGEAPLEGPRLIEVGTRDAANVFHPLETVPAGEHLLVRIVWTPYRAGKKLRLDAISPSGRTYAAALELGPETSRTDTPIGAPLPLEGGRWTIVLWDGATRLKSAGVRVIAAQSD